MSNLFTLLRRIMYCNSGRGFLKVITAGRRENSTSSKRSWKRIPVVRTFDLKMAATGTDRTMERPQERPPLGAPDERTKLTCILFHRGFWKRTGIVPLPT
ncbi:hypothetical protein ANANG_G00066790 [Anguilla anguilla]|uniref:Uncharacterized protein n=1 Tax=Anguilla anguilla TaxID=7936 RepID=A0A9D3S317_ANGAN|nr:hypothetical protein ANANG_G00066790 [Anguilla anguilla]